MDAKSSLLLLVATPDRAFLVLLIGLLLIYRELARPGRIVPGVLGGIAALTALWALAQYRLSIPGLALLSVGLFLVVLQATGRWWWIPGAVGTAACTFGARMALAPPARISWPVVLMVIPFSAITVFLLRIAVRARRNKFSGARAR